jgi:hypothetical protein
MIIISSREYEHRHTRYIVSLMITDSHRAALYPIYYNGDGGLHPKRKTRIVAKNAHRVERRRLILRLKLKAKGVVAKGYFLV